jgi:hypothetical protein
MPEQGVAGTMLDEMLSLVPPDVEFMMTARGPAAVAFAPLANQRDKTQERIRSHFDQANGSTVQLLHDAGLWDQFQKRIFRSLVAGRKIRIAREIQRPNSYDACLLVAYDYHVEQAVAVHVKPQARSATTFQGREIYELFRAEEKQQRKSYFVTTAAPTVLVVGNELGIVQEVLTRRQGRHENLCSEFPDWATASEEDLFLALRINRAQQPAPGRQSLPAIDPRGLGLQVRWNLRSGADMTLTYASDSPNADELMRKALRQILQLEVAPRRTSSKTLEIALLNEGPSNTPLEPKPVELYPVFDTLILLDILTY